MKSRDNFDGDETHEVTRRSFLGYAGALALAPHLLKPKRIPVGIELYSVRDELARDLEGTLREVARLGYEVVEFYAPYFQWTSAYARDVRKLLDQLKLKCLSTHNHDEALSGPGLAKAQELNQILGSSTIVLASAPRDAGPDAWKQLAERLTNASKALQSVGMRTGYHNHTPEFVRSGGTFPMAVIAANTPQEVTLQLDVGTCVEAGYDPVTWINANPGRVRSVHCKDWGAGSEPERGYRVLFGEGDAKWKAIFSAAEKRGGVECFLIEQEGSRYAALETAQRCLATYKKLRA